MRVSVALLVMLGCLWGDAGTALASPAGDPPADTLTAVERYVGDWVARNGLPGAALGVISGDHLVLARGFGVADLRTGEAATPQTRYTIGSLGKSLTSTAILQLRDRGLVELDAPVQRYLPWFRVADPADSARISVRHLLTHTSGLPGNADFEVYRQDPAAVRPSIERGVRGLRIISLAQPPGAAYDYSNLGYATLGLVVEAASGEAYPAYVRRHILDPLGMAHTAFEQPEPLPPGTARRYAWQFGQLVEFPWTLGPFLLPAGAGMVSSIEDMARYASAQLGASPTALLSPASLTEAHTGGAARPGTDARYSFAWVNQQVGSSKIVWHNGDDGGASAFLGLLPDEQLAVVLLVVGDADPAKNQVGLMTMSLLLGRDLPPLSPDFILGKSAGWVAAVVALVGAALLAWLVLTVRHTRRSGRRPRRHWLNSLRAVLLVSLAVGVWWSVIRLAQTLPPLGIAGPLGIWPVDIYIASALLIGATTLWAVYAVVMLLRAVPRVANARQPAVDASTA